PMRNERRRERVRDRFGILLVLLIGSFLALGFTDSTWGRVIAAVLEAAALVACLLTTQLRADHRWLGMVAAVCLLTLIPGPISGELGGGIADIALILLFITILIAVLSRVLRHPRVTLQTLYGAVCAYFLIGLMFSSLYGALDNLDSEPLFGKQVNHSVYSYFSFITLTTIGYGDYTAQTNLGRRVAAIEGVTGQLFLATAVARLVALYRNDPTPEEE